jgi:hypothetical protein
MRIYEKEIKFDCNCQFCREYNPCLIGNTRIKSDSKELIEDVVSVFGTGKTVSYTLKNGKTLYEEELDSRYEYITIEFE